MASNSLSKGQQNFTTLAIACVDEIRIVFRDILESKIKIDDLYTKIQSCQDLSTGDYKLETIQREICEKATDYEKFDVTLLYKLIRNLCLNHEPSKRKGKTLSKSNLRNIKDAIEYLKEFRNEAYAHLTSSEVSDEEFTQHWDNLEKHIHKIQTFMESLGKKVHYKEDIASIKRIRYYQNDLNKYKNLLELIVILWKQLENKDAPFITVEGNGEILCGEKACFEAVTKNCPVNNNWQITWQRIRGKITEIIDISEKKYDGSSSKRLVIPRVSMEDDGEYQAVIATVHKGTLSYVTSNSFRLDVIGDPPNLDIKEAITGIDITILYNIENTSPVIEKIEWTKDKKRLEMDPTKYKGGGITDNYLEILSPSENDAGEYKCTVSNAVGSVVKQIVLAVASVEICKELKVPLGGCATIESSIQSCPSLKEVVWQRSKDGKPENFMTIDINDVTYFGSNSDKNKPTLEIRNASYGDNLYYRLKVANGIGITTSNAVIVELVGDYPSVFTYHETKTRDMSVKLLCKVSLSEGSPEVTNVVWTKDKKDIEISSSGGKFGEENTEEFSLLIHKVNANDAGEYQCRVSNSVGCMYGNPIYLDKPIVQIGSPERDDKSDVIIYHATIESIPEALKAEWRVQQIPEDDFKPINVHDSSYRGSTVSLPYPVLTVHGYSQKHGQRFEIRVTNFIGETREVIYDKKIQNEDHDHMAHRKKMDFFRKRGSKTSFAHLRDELENSFPQKDLERFKSLLIDQEAVTEGAVSTCNTLRKVLEILKREGLFSNCDVILVQYVLRRIGCLDLYERCYKYAQACEALCFFERQPENGYTTVGFHIDGNIKEYSKEDIYSIRDTVANMLECSEEYVVISGIELVKSFLVVLSIKEEYIFAVLSNAQDIFERLRSLNVDYLAWGDTVIRKGHTSKEQDVELAKWITEDKLYQETHCFHEMMERVRSQKFVTFVGGPGSGKSATAHHIALMLQSEKYAVKPVKDLRGIIQMEEFNYSYKQVFVIDDVIGVFGLQRTKLVFFDDVFSRLFKYEKCKILFTCRETVYRESLSYDPSFEWYENIINLHSSEYALDDNDKKLMMENYGLRCELLSPSLLTSASHMFPFLCKLFSKEEKFRNFGSKFFTNPNECIITELDEMQAKNKFFYATLVLCIMNKKLSEDILKDKKNSVFLEMKNGVLESLELQNSTDTSKFLEALSEMEGTYTKKSGTEYTFIHDYVYELCAYHYGQQFPVQMLQYTSSNYIANKVKLQKNEASKVYKSEEKEVFDSDNGDDRNNKNGDKGTGSEECFDLCIWLSEDLYPLLAKRLYRDIQEMELDNLFTNDVLKHPKVCQTFIDVLKEKSYNEIKSLFLYERLFSRISEVKVRVLTWVILYGHYDILQYIVGEIEKYGKNKSDLFYRDVEHQHWNTLKKTLNKDILSDEERYMLLLSSYSGNLETVKIVLKFVNKDSIKKPIKRKYLETRLLNSKVENEYRWKCVPLVVAFEGGHLNIVHELIKAEAGINLTDKEGRTPLIIACDGGHLSIAQELIKFGADLNVRDIQGNTAMITAFKRGHFDLMQELIEAGADVNLPSEDGHIILIDACEGGHLNIVQNLIKAGADINIRDKEGKIAVVTASMKGNLSIVQDLVKAGADINLKNKEGNTPLITACEGGYLNMVQELIKMGAVVNVQNIMGKSPLIAACIGGYMCIVQELFKVRADVNHIGMVKNTPLVAACKYGHLNIVQELIKMGADVNLQDNEECTPIKAAREGEHLNIVKELVKMGVDDS